MGVLCITLLPFLSLSAQAATVPGVPQNLIATPGNAQVYLHWDPPSSDGSSPITGYKIHRGVTDAILYPLATIGNVRTYTDTGLTNGQTYYYLVSAVNAIGEGTPRLVHATPTSSSSTSVPSAPLNVEATVSGADIVITWDPPAIIGGDGYCGYEVWRGTYPGNMEQQYGSLARVTWNGYQWSYTDSWNIQVGTTYYYYVVATNSYGSSEPSQQVSATAQVDPALLNELYLLNQQAVQRQQQQQMMIIIGILAVAAIASISIIYVRRKRKKGRIQM